MLCDVNHAKLKKQYPVAQTGKQTQTILQASFSEFIDYELTPHETNLLINLYVRTIQFLPRKHRRTGYNRALQANNSQVSIILPKFRAEKA